MHSHEWPHQLMAPVPAQSPPSQCWRSLNAHTGANLQWRAVLVWEVEALPGAGDARFSSDLTVTVSSNLPKCCSVAECIGVLWWKALGFWGVGGMFLWKAAKVSPQLLWNHCGFTTVRELRWTSCSGRSKVLKTTKCHWGISFEFLPANRYHGEVLKTPKPLICL